MSDPNQNPETRIALFQRKEVRRTIHNNEWWFVVEDVVHALTDSADSKQYIQRMKQRDPELGKGWVQIVHTLSVETPAARNRCSVPIPKASSASSNPFPARRPSHSNAGSRGAGTRESRRLKTQNSPPNAPAPSTKPRAIRTTGSRKGCVPSPSATN